MEQFTDEQLVAIAQSSADEAAFTALFERRQDKLRRFLSGKFAQKYSYTSTDTDAVVEDVMQESYVKAFMNINRFEGKSLFSTWLFSIAINEYRQYQRKVSIYDKLKALFHKENVENSKNKEQSFTPQLDVFLDFDKRASKLNDKQLDTYVLSTIYGLSHNEIAKKLQLPLGSVKSYLAQATTLIRDNSS